jgi:hypothetical protein
VDAAEKLDENRVCPMAVEPIMRRTAASRRLYFIGNDERPGFLGSSTKFEPGWSAAGDARVEGARACERSLECGESQRMR